MKDLMLVLFHRGQRLVPVALTKNPDALRYFKLTVLLDESARVQGANDEIEAKLHRLEYLRIKEALDILIPEQKDKRAKKNGKA